MGDAAIKLSLNDSAFAAGIKRANAQFSQGASEMMNVAGKLGALFTAVAGGGLTYLIGKSIDAGDTLGNTASKLGVAADALAGLEWAGKKAGIEVNTTDMAMQRFTRRVAEAARGTGEAKSALQELGLDAKKLGALPLDQQMAEVAAAFGKVSNQSDKVRLAFKLFDSEGVAMVNMLAGGADGLNAAAQEARDLGIALDNVQVARLQQADNAFKTIQAAITGVVNKLTIELAPWITAVSNQFIDFAKSARTSNINIADGIGMIIKALGKLGDAIVVAAWGWKKLEIGFGVAKASIIEGLGTIDTKLNDVFGKPKGESGSWLTEVFKNTIGAIPIVGSTFEKEIGQKTVDWGQRSNEAWAGVAETFSEMDALLAGGLPSENLDAWFANLQSNVAKLKAEAAAVKPPVGGGGGSTPGMSDADAKAAAKAAEEQAKQDDQLAAMAIERWRNTGLQKFEIRREELARLKQLGQISGEDELAALRQISDQELQIEIEAAKMHAQLVRGKPVEYQRAMDKIAEIQRKHDLAMSKHQTKVALEQKAFYDKIFAPITQAFEKSVTGMIQGTISFRKAMRQMAQSITMEFVNMGVKLVVEWIKNEAMKTAATAAGTSARTGIESAGAGQSLLISAGTAVKQILMSAWETMANVYKAIAAIPVVGPFLAPVMAAGAFGLVAGFASNIASASGGFDIPSGMNPMTQLHQQEMVLPAHIANPLRDMIASGQSGGGNTTVVVQAMDARSFQQYVTRNASSLPPALKKIARNNMRG